MIIAQFYGCPLKTEEYTLVRHDWVTELNWTEHFKWLDFMVCEFYLNKNILKHFLTQHEIF